VKACMSNEVLSVMNRSLNKAWKSNRQHGSTLQYKDLENMLEGCHGLRVKKLTYQKMRISWWGR
jgi:undecaprenyl pyrophosphate synthase